MAKLLFIRSGKAIRTNSNQHMQLEEQGLKRARRATQLIFLVCGLGIASWAPMVPYAKDRLGLHEGQLGLLLLFLGCGALVMMPITGILINRFGSRVVIGAAAMLMAILLPLLLIIDTYVPMAAALLLFGAAVGSIDVAMNAHGVKVQHLYGRPIMSSLHGLFSIGGLAGSLGLGFLIKAGLEPVHAAISVSILLIIITFSQFKSLFNSTLERQVSTTYSTATGTQVQENRFLWLRGSVIFLGMLCFSAFLAEGAMLDWSAVFLRDTKGVSQELSGAGYAAFSIAMAAMRLAGDGLVERFNNKTVVSGGSLLAAIGLTIAIVSPWTPLVLAGYILLGIGAANIVPIFFSDGGSIPGIPAAISIPAITTIGYAGQLAGPALLGFVAHHFSLAAAFGCCAVLLAGISVAYLLKKQHTPLTATK
ncbi:MFS transporter [Chitinophaga rhizophila]|uniref:MFS transporter n=1 Tax=Chitinophaga rhizophila TaxID=2866212 RepID=A0ABS7GI39_9BACT|nr:MFS transporter [Chitinophaga rhizophila]MBW8687371.1 MFS transporter [Chitinophaga rhizophila]